MSYDLSKAFLVAVVDYFIVISEILIPFEDSGPNSSRFPSS